MLRAVVLTQYPRVTRQTDGNTIASTALAMRALRRAVKTDYWVYPIHLIDNNGQCKPIPAKFNEYYFTAVSWSQWSALTLYNEVMNMFISLADVVNARVIARIIQLNVRYV